MAAETQSGSGTGPDGGSNPGTWDQIKGKVGFYIKLGFLLFLVVLLLVPLALIENLVGERKSRRDTAVAGIAQSWGNPQRVTGPVLVIPYRYTIPPQPFVNARGETRMTPAETRTGVIHALPVPVQPAVEAVITRFDLPVLYPQGGHLGGAEHKFESSELSQNKRF